jgi:hypothetical protein
MRGQGSPLTDAASGPTAAEWAAAMLATLPRLTTTARPPRADDQDQPDRPTGAAA